MRWGIQMNGRSYPFAELATRLTTGSVHDRGIWQADTVRLVVMRWPPAFLRTEPYAGQWSPLGAFAPTVETLRTYRNQQMSWEVFAEQYRRRLDQLSQGAVLDQIWEHWLLFLLRSAPTITLLCAEQGDEQTVRCHRRLLRSWLLGEEIRA